MINKRKGTAVGVVIDEGRFLRFWQDTFDRNEEELPLYGRGDPSSVTIAQIQTYMNRSPKKAPGHDKIVN